MTKPFDPNKPYRRRDGKPAKIVHKFNIDTYLVVVENNFPDEAYYQVGLLGKYISGAETGKDLINIPEKIDGWIGVTKYMVYPTAEEANKCALASNRIYDACIKVSFTEGEGLVE